MLFFIFFLQNSTLKLGIFHNKNNYLCKHKNTIMSLLRVFFSNNIPTFSCHRQRCGSILIVFLLTLCGWVPGVIAALVILNKN